MKKWGKILSIVLSLSLFLFLMGCGILSSTNDLIIRDTAVLESDDLTIDNAPTEDAKGITTVPDNEIASQIDDGAVNTASVLKLSYYAASNYSCMIPQGTGIYYLYAGMIQRMPMGGKLEDIQRIFNASAEAGEPNNLQILGDWAYFTTRYDGGTLGGETMYHQNIYRVRTDGTQLECLADNMTYPHYYYGMGYSIEPLSTFVIQNDNLYYAQLTWAQSDASTVDFTCSMVRLSLLDGSKTVMYAEPVESPSYSFGICSLSGSNCILEWPGSAQINIYLWQIGSETLLSGPEWITETCHLYEDSDGSLLVWDFGKKILYYAKADQLEDPEIIREDFDPFYAEKIAIADGVIYFADNTALYRIEDHELIKINNDGTACNLSYPGDGYLYYAININIRDSILYRVHPDGSGWEQLGDWWN